MKREVAAEDLRIAYVALTRAEHRCTIVWGGFSGLSSSAVGYLLHPPPELAHGELPKATRLDKHSDEQLANDLAELAERSGGDIALRRVSITDRGALLEIPVSVRPLQPARTIERLATEWQRTESFSGLTKHEPAALPDGAARDHDERVAVPSEPLEASERAEVGWPTRADRARWVPARPARRRVLPRAVRGNRFRVRERRGAVVLAVTTEGFASAWRRSGRPTWWVGVRCGGAHTLETHSTRFVKLAACAGRPLQRARVSRAGGELA